MLPSLFSDPFVISMGIITGFILGFVIQKGKVSQLPVIIGQLLLKDFTMLKIVITAIIVGAISINLLVDLGMPIEVSEKGGSVLAVVLGGIIFAIGVVIFGYCPATSVAAAAQGSHDAWFGILGMLVGAGIFAEVYPFFRDNIMTIGKINKGTLDKLTGLSPWIIILILLISSSVFFFFIRKKKAS